MEHNHMLSRHFEGPLLPQEQHAQGQGDGNPPGPGLPPLMLPDVPQDTNLSVQKLQQPQHQRQHHLPSSADIFLFNHNHPLNSSHHPSSPHSHPHKHGHGHSHSQSRSSLPLHLQSPYSPSLSSPSLPTAPLLATSHDPSTLTFPDAPTTELAPIQPHGDVVSGAHNTLPPLSSVTGAPLPPRYSSFQPSDSSSYAPSPPKPALTHWPSLNPLTAYYTPSHVQGAESPQRMDVDMSGTMNAASPGRPSDARASSVTLDDPDVRLAAEALGDLRADLQTSPKRAPVSTSTYPADPMHREQPEPLLSLLTTSHPLLATTIEGATSAYNNSKNFSPRFKTGAEYVEGYLTPIANTVGSVGRVTGVEGGVRWFLGAGRRHQSSTDLEADGGSNKRRKVHASDEKSLDALADRAMLSDSELYGFSNKDRRTSMSTVDTLPAYDDYRSPAYSESIENPNQVSSRPSSGASTAWQQRLIMSTSGLSIAMSEESLRSLKYCLRWLRWANEHIGKVISTLKTTLDQYDGPREATPVAGSTEQSANGDHDMTDAPPHHHEDTTIHQDQGELAARINALKSDVLKTLRDVIETVSKYAGGALPDNARVLVRRHLTSLPQRFRLAAMQDASPQHQEEGAEEKDMREGAQRVLVLAKEGLDMMAQVSGVLDGTISSAEEWCDRLGKKKREERDVLMGRSTPPAPETIPLTSVGVDGDVKMG